MSKRSRRRKRQPKVIVKVDQPGLDGQTLQLPQQIMTAFGQVTRTYQGPIPPPEMLAEFDRLDPGRAAKLLNLAEDQTRHRMSLEQQVIQSDIRRSWWGLISAFAITTTTVLVGGGVVLAGHDVAGTILGGTGLAGVASVFIYGTLSRRQERVEKRKLVSGGKR